MINMVNTYETLRELLEKIEEEYANIEDEETDEDITERRWENLDDLKGAIEGVIGEMANYEMIEDEIEEEKQEA